MLGKFNEVMGFVRHGGGRLIVGQAHVPLLALMPQRSANEGARLSARGCPGVRQMSAADRVVRQ
ncbi:MAG: hypothetical protein QOH82_1971 [Mycobacterium sp.]|nr:hypothetical protein [Mycobacterium sp.]